LYREAANLAYYFNWPRNDIMGMTGEERRIWLDQIMRIHREQRQARQEESRMDAERILKMRRQAEEGGQE
jgi:hypothetical protein